MSSAQILTHANLPWWNQLGTLAGTSLESERRSAMQTIDARLQDLMTRASSAPSSVRSRARSILDTAAAQVEINRRFISRSATSVEEISSQLAEALTILGNAKSQIMDLTSGTGGGGGGGGTTGGGGGGGGGEPPPISPPSSNRTLIIGAAVAIVAVGALVIFTSR